MSPPLWILPVIVAAQFACTATWFAGNAVMPDLRAEWGLPATLTSWVTSSTQLGFIAGTLISALALLSDRLEKRRLFFLSASAAALFNLLPLIFRGAPALLVSRFLTGVALAGIYPVGMALAASWYNRGLGRALGWLVGALVLGTALPHLLRGGAGLPSWRATLGVVSALAFAGGALVGVAVKDGPHGCRAKALRLGAWGEIFGNARFRAAATGYFGHMWEVYAFWAFLPFIVKTYARARGIQLNVSLTSGILIGLGAPGCVLGGWLSQKWGSGPVAAFTLGLGAVCGLVLPWSFGLGLWPMLALLGVWGMAVASDSPQFSALNAASAPREYVGTALTPVTCIGYAVTIGSVALLGALRDTLPPQWLLSPLLLGPLVGLLGLRRVLPGWSHGERR